MEAKDTALKPSELLPVLNGKSLIPPFYIGIKEILEAQAGISFKAGRREAILDMEKQVADAYIGGIREAVEFIQEKRETPLGTDPFGYYIWESELQAQLKEWGIEDANL